MASQRDKESEGAERGEKPERWEAVARMLDALASEDPEAYRQVLESNPELHAEFAGLDRAYQRIREAVKGESLGPEYDEIDKRLDQWARELQDEEGPGVWTRALHGRPREEVQELLATLAIPVIAVILEEVERVEPVEEIERIAAVLSSERVQNGLLAAKHVRDEFVRVVAEELGDMSIVEKVSKERLFELVTQRKKRNTLIAFEDLTLQAIR